ncbi:MAG: hypothetical protein K8R56_01980 [Candidatus Eisenbacteria bacterium]|nr:hypothetical protein [Candidatus Eisenbacteria bacterium]
MSAAARVHLEPVDRLAPGTGSGVSDALRPEFERVLAWAGPDLLALVLAGSHASGEAVWATVQGQRVSLSDLDLYALLPTETACAYARARARAERSAVVTGSALVGPLEVAWITPEGLGRMPARPGTLELARTGRVIAGAPRAFAPSAHWTAGHVSAEERVLLLENRAFELLWAWLAPSEGLPALRARHAVLKASLEIAGARLLARGEWPAGAAARVAAARTLPAPEALPTWLAGSWAGLDPVWSEALAWRANDASVTPASAFPDAWYAVVRGWVAVWWHEAATGLEPNEPFARVLHSARRGSLARRVRRSLGYRANDGHTPPLADRLLRATHGTPALRIHGSAVALLLAASLAPSSPRLSGEALRALSALGVTRATTFADAALDVVRAWDRALHEGLRTGGEA